MRLMAVALSMAMTVSTATAADLLPDEMSRAVERLAELPLHPIEGIWQLPGHDSELLIIRDSITPSGNVARYRIEVVTADSHAVRSGTPVGYATPTASPGVYDSRIYTDVEAGRHIIPVSPGKFSLILTDDDSRLKAKRYGRNVEVKWWRLLPYMLRWTFSITRSPAPDTDGLVRVYPSPALPENPVYL